MLAESFVSFPVQIGIYLGCTLACLMLLNEGCKFLDRFKTKPPHPPNDLIDKRLGELENKFEAERNANEIHVSTSSSRIYDKLETTAARLEVKLETQMEQSIKARQNLQDRIDPISHNVAEMKGRSESFTTAFNNFTEMMKASVEAQKATTEVLKALIDYQRK